MSNQSDLEYKSSMGNKTLQICVFFSVDPLFYLTFKKGVQRCTYPGSSFFDLEWYLIEMYTKLTNNVYVYMINNIPQFIFG